MSKSSILKTAASKGCGVIFCDFFDTLVHRRVHPNYVLRLWSKHMIRELGLQLKIDELYFIRKESEIHLSNVLQKLTLEVAYKQVINEVYNRLLCTNNLSGISLHVFSEYFELADYYSEIKVQYLNSNAIESLKTLKANGCEIYCLSDFYMSSAVLKKVMDYHSIKHIFNDVFVSAEFNASKHNGELYLKIINKLKISPENVLMIGDNLKSDITNAKAIGMHTLHIPNTKFSKTNLRSALGADTRDYRGILKSLYKKCNHKSAPPNSDYILFYTVYIERLYQHAKKNDLKNILFLSREGLYLKKMFDFYQAKVALKNDDKINSHYLRTSRQAAMLVSLMAVDEETFSFLRNKYPDLSLYAFLKNLDLSEKAIETIQVELGFDIDGRKKIVGFLDSEIFKRLVKNDFFRKIYEEKRWEQKNAFTYYLKSFDIDFYAEGMHLADIGWGGSMQERLFEYFEREVNVYGYYLGIREVYNIAGKTKRFGLNFTVFPYPTFSDNILRGNIELSEQLLSAPHGSAISYDASINTYTKEFHYEDEKRIFEAYIFNIQEFMFDRFKNLLDNLEVICYDNDIVQKEMTDYALRVGIFASKRKIEGAMKISEGFYTNVGDFSKGLTIGTNMNKMGILREAKTFVLGPDKVFRYILRVKPFLYTRNMYFLAYLMPSYLVYKYIKLNIWFRTSILANNSYLKYSYLK